MDYVKITEELINNIENNTDKRLIDFNEKITRFEILKKLLRREAKRAETGANDQMFWYFLGLVATKMAVSKALLSTIPMTRN